MADFVVTTFADENDAESGVGAPSGLGLSLREALALANANADANTITFDGSLSGQTLYLTNGQLSITSDGVTIDGDIHGDGTAGITISANHSSSTNDASSRVFSIDDGTNATIATTLNGLVIQDGYVDSSTAGGGIAVGAADALTLSNATVSGNRAGDGGGIYNGHGSIVTLSNTTLSGNHADFSGGGIFSYGSLTLTNATLSDNIAAIRSGGGIANGGIATLVNTTLSGNGAHLNGGGIHNGGSTVTLTNSIVAGNFADRGTGDEISDFGTLNLIGGNIVGDTFTRDGVNQQTGLLLTDIFASVTHAPLGNVLSGTLADNGGSPQTIALAASMTNPALDAGNDAIDAAGDARGLARVDVPGVAHNGANVSDLGAFELQASALETPSLVVTTLSEAVNPFDNLTSLREALSLANAAAGADTITFDTSLAGGTLYLTRGELRITTSGVTIDGDIDGDGKADITISANHSANAHDANSRVFIIDDGDNTTTIASALNGLVIRDGVADVGAGIGVGGADALTLTNSTVTGNSADTAGGGVFNSTGGMITLSNTTLSDNDAGDHGGGIFNFGTATLSDTTLSGNTGRLGGGIFNAGYGSLTLTNTTLSGNEAGFSGGGIFNVGTATLTDATLSGNKAGDNGGGISNYATATATVALTNSIVAGNDAGTSGDDIQSAGALTLAGGNIVGATLTIGGAVQQTGIALTDIFASVTNDPNTGVLSGTLAGNGGPIQTIALKAGASNPALDAGDDGLAPAADARGTARDDVAGAANNGTNVSDLGAFEAHPTPADLVITTLADGGDDDYGGYDFAIEMADGGGLSLREALALANANPDTNTITFDSTLFHGTLYLQSGELVISTDGITVDGDIDHDGRADIAISADSSGGADDATSRVFLISDNTASRISAKLNGLVILDGKATNGGGIAVGAGDALTLTNATVADNHVDDVGSNGRGGGIGAAAGSDVVLNSVTVSDNDASYSGGGIGSLGTVTLINTTVSDNVISSGDGGGIYAVTAILTNTTVSGNHTGWYAGGIAANTAILTNTTVSGNSGYADGGLLAGNVTLTNSILAGNSGNYHSDDARFVTSMTMHGDNIVGNDVFHADGTTSTTALADVFADIVTVDPHGIGNVAPFQAGALSDNGGSVATIALNPGASNPALDAGDAGQLSEASVHRDLNGDGDQADTIATDARGFDRDVGAHVDIGAFEQQNGAEFIVTTLDDGIDNDFGGGSLAAEMADGGGLSLREALGLADGDPTTADTIKFLASLKDGILTLKGGELVITSDVTIDGDIHGDGTRDITIDAAGDSRILNIINGTSSLNGLIITGGDVTCGCSGFYGGGISVGAYASYGYADVTISNSSIRNSTALYGGGVSVDTGSSLRLVNSTVAQNHAGIGGGIAVTDGGTLTVITSTVSDNHADLGPGGYGGGIANAGTTSLTNSTISGNSGISGGGVYNSGDLTLINVTLANNSADYGGGLYNAPCGCGTATLVSSTVSGNFSSRMGGGIYNANGTVDLVNSIVAGNGTGYAGRDLVAGGTMTYAGVNLIDIDEPNLAHIFATLATIDPDGIAGNGDEFQAGLLANNGGRVQTIAIAQGGVAHNTGGNAQLPADTQDLDGDSDTGENLPFDARGLVRLYDGMLDTGGFEIQNSTPKQGANTGLTLNEGASAIIAAAALGFNDAEQAGNAIIFTVTTPATNGALSRNGVVLGLGDTFSQDDIDNNRIRYTHDGSETIAAAFGFSVSDGVAAPITGQSFAFTINPVNDAPVLHGVAAAAAYSGGPAVILAPGLAISDVDNATLSSATVHVSAGAFTGHGDLLAVSAADLAGTSIVASYNAATETLTLSGTDTLAHYSQVLERVTFQTTNFGLDRAQSIVWQLNDGSPSNNLSTVETTAISLPRPPASDFSGDGHGDILWQNNDGTPAVWLTDGTSLLSGANVGFNPGPAWHVIGSGDFNGDGKSDILWQNNDGTIAEWFMNGTTLLSGASVAFNPGPAWHAIGTGDFNGDGKSDILWQNNDGTPAVWLMNGTNILSGANVGFNPGAAWHVIGAGDFNGDGKADILWQNADGTPAVWLMDGLNLISGSNVGFNPGPAWHTIGTGDFNGDGKADILWQNADGTPAVWLMNGTSLIAGANVGFNPGPAWHAVNTGDYNADGKSDILWQNNDGTPAVWLMDGLNLISGANVGFNPGTAWHVIPQHHDLFV